MKRLSLSIIAFALLVVGVARAESAATTQPTVVRIGFTVSDLDREAAFLTHVLGFREESEVQRSGSAFDHETGLANARARVGRFRLGDEEMELTEFIAPHGRENPRDARSNDHWFQHVAIITSDMDRAYARLRENKVRHASSAPQRLPDWNPAAAGIRAFYFFDPDGHVMEVLQFPPGKGESRWHATDRLFLGIDHTAIVVSDTDRSLAFYHGQLGFSVVGGSENWGVEQEHLNGVFGAHLRITTLRGAAGPAIELLEYLAPSDGRPYPTDARANDLFHWRTSVVRPDQAHTLTRDPDGHVVQLSTVEH
jgi:catechol 2,3-dioxygenase-like lactoylglutathione lyase family enzyme